MSLAEMWPIHKERWTSFLSEAKRLREARRDFGPTGAAALSTLIKQELDGYNLVGRGSVYVPLRADALAEPSDPSKEVSLLSALPPELAERYVCEEALLQGRAWCEKDWSLLRRLGGTIGGDKEEYAKYIKRADVIPLWFS